jgi:type I restriction enzyme S subunit
LKIGDFSDFIFELPTLAEQEKIAEVLSTVDEEIRKTDEVILATEKLKGGLMQELFTKGIGHTKFKETKIGQIPEEWNASLMAEKIDFQEGPGILAKDFHESGVPLIRLEGINSDSLLNGCNYLDRDLVVKKWSHFKLQKGDILLSSSASLGRVAVVEDEGVGAIAYTGIVRFRSQDTSVSNNFIQCFLTSPIFQEQIGSHDTGSTIKHFGPSHLKKMWFVVPSIKEQKKITEILSATNEKISVNKKLKEKLTLLKKGLMQDLLSGKVRTKEYEL